MTIQSILIAILAADVILLIRAEILKIKRQSYIFKPLATPLVIAICLLSLSTPNYNPIYTWGVLIGLVFSLGGDVALLFQEQRKPFMIGLALFLIAHIVYIVIFSRFGQIRLFGWLVAGLLAVAAIGFYRLISPNLGSMKIPVIFYITIISIMALTAFNTFAGVGLSTAQAWMIFLGAFFFYISDIILAATRFWRPWKYGRISLGFYFGGQLLIALAASYF
jgi:uncharacterized membrane protein YhhN